METAFYRRDAPAGNPRPGPNNVGGPATPDQRAALRPRIGTRGLNNDDLFERDGVEHSYSPLETLVRQTSLKGGWRVKPGASASSTSLGATRATTTTSAGSAGAPAREAAGPPSSSYSANNNPNVVNAAAGGLSMRVQMSAGSSSANTRRTAPTHRALAAASSYLDSYYGLSDANTYVPPDRLQPQNSQNHQNFHAPLTSPLLHTQFRDSTAESSSDIDPLRDSTFYNSDVSPTSSPSANQTAYPRAPSGPPSSNAVPPRGGNLLASNPAGSSHRPSVPPAPLRLPRLTLDDSVIDRDQIQIQWDSDPDSASLFDDPARRSTLTARSGSVSAVRGMGILPPSFTFREEIESPSEEIDGMSFNQGHGRPLSDRSLVLPPSVRNFGIPPPLPRHSSQSNTSPLNPRSPGVESFNSESSFYPSSASPHALTHSPADLPQPLPQTQSDKPTSEPSSARPSLPTTQSSGPSNTPAAPSQSQSLVNPTLASSAPSSTPVAADVAAAQRRLRTVTMTTVASVSVYDDDGEDGGGGNNNQENNRAGQTSFVDTSFDDDEDYADDYAAADQRPISTLEDTVDLAAVLESSSRAKWKPLALNSPSANGSPLVSPGGGGGGGGFGQQQQQQGTEPESESRDVQRKQQKGGYRQSDLDPFAFRQYEGMRRPSASGGGPGVGDGDTAGVYFLRRPLLCVWY
ncbi:hypothetical protein DL93DRAFT_1567350 [Clavulina sp. PMI_390]|nr:hypothetical protein DL93DRAFT_1567350 [Clavulina sp. PMI_390]